MRPRTTSRPRITAVTTGLLIAWVCLPAWAAREIGDAAPPLQIASWVKGGPIDLAAGKGKHIYVVEFWATWCGPCKVSIPHLTELQHRYKDKGVIVIGISDESAEVVKPFVDEASSQMDYVVATDKRSATGRAYMAAFGAEGIPYAFVIDKEGRIAWNGHPMGGLDAVLERMVAGKFDINIAIESARAGKLMNDYLVLVRRWNAATDPDARKQIAERARQVGESVIKAAPHSPDALYELSWNILLMPETQYRDLELAAKAAEAAYKATPHQPVDKARKLVHDYFRTVQSATDTAKPNLGKLNEISEGILKDGDPQLLNDFAWTLLLAGPVLKHDDLGLGLRMAKAANDATKGQDASILDTYSLALFKTGKRDQAIEQIKKAIAVNKDKAMSAHLQEVLQAYQREPVGKPDAAEDERAKKPE